MSSEYASCTDCGRKWTGYSQAHCRGCHRTFSSVSVFDAHNPGGVCGDPPSINSKKKPTGFMLVDSTFGPIWTRPMDEKRLEGLRQQRREESV